tara:strand:- start:44 stop:766 length:723 start_codon:yes stop_codon:yes gene_type:complete
MLFISPPFGNYFNLPGSISITGSFTTEPRDGKWIQILKTLRYSWKYGCWCNKIGLRNPGIDWAVANYKKGTITSIAILKREDIEVFKQKIPDDMDLEINISCPNVDHKLICDDIETFLNDTRRFTIVKLSPTDSLELVNMLYVKGFRQFHFSNTLPTRELPDCKHQGGMSGSVIIPYTTGLVVKTRAKYPDVEIIAGGGVRDLTIAKNYLYHGANHISVSSLLFNPFRFILFYKNWLSYF